MDEPKKYTIGVAIELTACAEHGAHVTAVRTLPPAQVAYEAAPDVIDSATSRPVAFGWSPSYGEGWESTFGKAGSN